MTKTKVSPTAEEAGINAVATIFTSDFEWAFRRQPILDWGVDAHVEIVENRNLTGKLIALQIKSGSSWFRRRASGNYVFYGEERHLRYWTNHSLPVFIIIHDPAIGLTLWQKFDQSRTKDGRNGRWSIDIPSDNILSSKFKPEFEAGIPAGDDAYRRFMLTIDYPFIARLLEEKRTGMITMRVDDWINKSLNMRNAYFYFPGNSRIDADYILMRWLPYSTLSEFMAVRFPWLDYEYAEEPEETDGELVTHIIEVSVNSLGRAVIEYETYIEQGAWERDSDASRPDGEAAL